MKITLAGAVFLFDFDGIRKAFADLGHEADFVDAPFMKSLATEEEKKHIVFRAEIPEGTTVIPLTEYWISKCTSSPEKCLVSETALRASRSKKFLYEKLSSSRNSSDSFRVPGTISSIDEAKRIIMAGKEIVVKPENLNSGYGVEIVGKEKVHLLEKYFFQADNVSNKILKLMEIKNSGAFLSEKIDGVEYSADLFCNKGAVSLVRLCRKNIVLVNDKPCCVTIELAEADEFFRETLSGWVKALFGDEDISFAQFDFIQEKNGCLVPIDFACRIGGGMKELLSSLETNPYAAAVRNEKPVFRKKVQLNYLPVKSGYVVEEKYNLAEGKQIIFKRRGDYVIANPTSVGSRIAVVIADENPFDGDFSGLLIKDGIEKK